MSRPRCCRRIDGLPACKMFKPAGLRLDALEEVRLSLEEYEAIRLADHEGLYQEDAAARMRVSRQTFGRTIEQARTKVARALVFGLALRIEARDEKEAAWAQDCAAPHAPRPACADDESRCPRCGRPNNTHEQSSQQGREASKP